MKVRTRFVSNSSSSSFIVIGQKPEYCESVELDEVQATNIIEFIRTREWDPVDISWDKDVSVYLTAFLSDTADDYHKATKDQNAYEYHSGGHGIPYDEERYHCLWEAWDNGFGDIWIWSGHDNPDNAPEDECPTCGRPYED